MGIKTDFKYEAARNKLIPFAEAHADKTVNPSAFKLLDKESWYKLWNKCYLDKMDSLWAEQCKMVEDDKFK